MLPNNLIGGKIYDCKGQILHGATVIVRNKYYLLGEDLWDRWAVFEYLEFDYLLS